MLIFKLDENYRSAVIDLVCRDNRNQTVEIAVHIGLELLVRLAHHHSGFEAQPNGISAAVPLGAVVGAHAHDGVHVRLFDQLEEGVQIMIVCEIKLSLARLVAVPEGVYLNAVEACAFQAKQAVLP
jgi:hypothetical protein